MNDSKNSMERCVLCLNEKRSPVRVQCGHSFCSGCLDVYKSYKRYPWASKCPICRDVLKEKRGTHWFIYFLIMLLFIVGCISTVLTIYTCITALGNICRY